MNELKLTLGCNIAEPAAKAYAVEPVAVDGGPVPGLLRSVVGAATAVIGGAGTAASCL